MIRIMDPGGYNMTACPAYTPMPQTKPMNEPQPHILVVDDDQRLRALLTRYLTEHGLHVSAVADGRAMDLALGRVYCYTIRSVNNTAGTLYKSFE